MNARVHNLEVEAMSYDFFSTHNRRPFLNLFLVMLFFSLVVNHAQSEEISAADCQRFLPYHSCNVATAGICGDILPAGVSQEHNHLRNTCTRLLGENRSMELMKQGVNEFKRNLSQSGGNKSFCANEV